MRALIRLLVCILAVAALFVGGAWAFARWQGGLVAGLDLPGAGRSLMEELHTGETLAARSRVAHERLVDKSVIVTALFDGRLSLREAGDEFRRLNAEKAEAEPTPPDAGPADAASDEAVYENLLVWIDAYAAARPEWGARADQLRAEVGSLWRRPLQGL